MKDSECNHRILGDIARIHHCDRCGKACWIDEGPPVVHRVLTMQQLSLWTKLVVCLSLYNSRSFVIIYSLYCVETRSCNEGQGS